MITEPVDVYFREDRGDGETIVTAGHGSISAIMFFSPSEHDGGAKVAAKSVKALVRADEVVGITEGEQLTVRGVAYRFGPRPDSHAPVFMWTLLLV